MRKERRGSVRRGRGIDQRVQRGSIEKKVHRRSSTHPPRPTRLHLLALPHLRILLPLQIRINNSQLRRLDSSHRPRQVHLQRAVRDRIVAVEDPSPERGVVRSQVESNPLEEVGGREGGFRGRVGGDGGRRVGLGRVETDRGVVEGVAEGARRARVRGEAGRRR